MALVTCCQATFQNLAGYEEDIAALQVSVRECYSEISKTSEEIQSSVRETYVTKSDMETVQSNLETSITQTSEDIRMDFTSVTDSIREDVAANQEQLAEYIRFAGALIELGKVGNAFTAELSNESLQFRESGAVVAYISNNKMHITTLEVTESAKLTCFEFRQRSNGHGIIRYKKLS